MPRNKTSLILYDLNLTLGYHRFYYIALFPVLDPICLSIERDNHEMHKQGICIECIEHGYMMTGPKCHVIK
jgi:hypothetical protein